MSVSVVLGVMEIVCGVPAIARRDHYASIVSPGRLARTRTVLLRLGVLLLLVGAFQLAEAFV